MKNLKSIYAIVAVLVLGTVLYSCLKTEEVKPQPVAQLSAGPQITAPVVEYVPVDWGAELKVVPNTITHRDRKPYGKSSQAMVYAFSKILPTNYLQDASKERTVIATRDSIGYTSKYYICKKVFK